MTVPHLRYRKKPVVIEAFQMTEERHHNNQDWPSWLHYAWNVGRDQTGGMWADGEVNTDDRVYYVGTLEGAHKVSMDDWLIRGIADEIYPCRDDIFQKTYEKAA